MTAKLECVHIYSREGPNQPAGQGGSQWHSSRIIVETGPSDRGWHAHAPRKNKEKRRRRLRCAKPSVRPPTPRRMRRKRPGRVEGYWFAEHRHFPGRDVSAIASGIVRVADLHARRTVRAQPLARRRQTFNSDAWVDVAAVITYIAARNQFSVCLATLPVYGAQPASPKLD